MAPYIFYAIAYFVFPASTKSWNIKILLLFCCDSATIHNGICC